MEDNKEKIIKKNSGLTKSKNANNLNDNNNNEQQLYPQFPEIILHKNSEPKDNIKKASHRRLMNFENQINLILGSDSKINENQKIHKNNMNEKDFIFSRSEVNNNKTFGFFQKEKEVDKDKETIPEKKEIILNYKNNYSNKKRNNSLLENENFIENKVHQFGILRKSFNKINNQIEFHDNKLIHIKKERKKLNLNLSSIKNTNDINSKNSSNDIIIKNTMNINQTNLDNENKYIKTELSNEKLPLDNMRHKIRKKEIKIEKGNKINKLNEKIIQKDESNENNKEKNNDNKIFKVDILDGKNEKNDTELYKQNDFDKKILNEKEENTKSKINEEKNKIINIKLQNNPVNQFINNNLAKQEDISKNNIQPLIGDKLLKIEIKDNILEKEENIKYIANDNIRKISEEMENNENIEEIAEMDKTKENIIKVEDENNKTNKEPEIIVIKEDIINNKEKKEEKVNELIVVNKNEEIHNLNDKNIINKNEKTIINSSESNLEKIEETKKEKSEIINENNNLNNQKLEEINKILEIKEDNIRKKENEINEESFPHDIKTIDNAIEEEKTEESIKEEKKDNIEINNVNDLKEELNKKDSKENLNLDNFDSKNIFTDRINSDIEILNLNNIKEKFDSNKTSEKNKIITDIYQIKIDIEKPTESMNTINTINNDSKEINNKNEKLSENVSKEEKEENKENIQDNFQNSKKKLDNIINNNQIIVESAKNILEEKVEINCNDRKLEQDKNKKGSFGLSEKKENLILQTNNKEETILKKDEQNLNDKIIDNNIRKIELTKSKENNKFNENKKKDALDKENKSINNNYSTIEKDNAKRRENKNLIFHKIESKKELKTKSIKKNEKKFKFNIEQKLNIKNVFSKNNYKNELYQSVDKINRNLKIISPFKNKLLKNNKKVKKPTRKEKYSPLTNRNIHLNTLEKKNISFYKTIETNDRLTEIKNKKKNEIKEKRIKNKNNLKKNFEVNPLTKYYSTELSFKNPTDKLLLKETKLEKKSFNNKSNIISIDKMKNAKIIINRKKKIEKILKGQNKYNSKSFNYKLHKNQKLNLIKETKEMKPKKNDLRNLLLKSREIKINISNKKNKSDSFSSSESSDLGDVGEIIEDEADSEFEAELINGLNENNFINNPKSIITYSSAILMKKNEKKRLSLSLSKIDNNPMYSPRFNINTENSKEKDKYYQLMNPDEIKDKIKKKENDIDKMKKLIEIANRNIKYYDKKILEVESYIKNEEQLRDDYQILINFFNLK